MPCTPGCSWFQLIVREGLRRCVRFSPKGKAQIENCVGNRGELFPRKVVKRIEVWDREVEVFDWFLVLTYVPHCNMRKNEVFYLKCRFQGIIKGQHQVCHFILSWFFFYMKIINWVFCLKHQMYCALHPAFCGRSLQSEGPFWEAITEQGQTDTGFHGPSECPLPHNGVCWFFFIALIVMISIEVFLALLEAVFSWQLTKLSFLYMLQVVKDARTGKLDHHSIPQLHISIRHG